MKNKKTNNHWNLRSDSLKTAAYWYLAQREKIAAADAKLQVHARVLRQAGKTVTVDYNGRRWKVQVIDGLKSTLDVHSVRETLGGDWVESHSTKTAFKSIHVAEVK